jgi:NAD(P)H-flavin reductase/ferredoxin
MATHSATLVFDDGRSVRIKADEKETIYLAALKARVRIQTDCLEGACATCRAHCTSGTYWLNEHSEEALSKEDEARRDVLTCQMYARSDCVIEFSYESKLALRNPPETRPGKVASIDEVADSVMRLAVEPEGTPIQFLPGQYVHLAVPGTDARRSYSFANPPESVDKLVFYIKLLDKGAMSEYVAGRAKIGDATAITGPFGRFYLRKAERPIVMVAGGTGLAPMLSMFDHLKASGQTAQPIRLLYGANRPEELFGLGQLEAFARDGLRLTTEYCVVAGGADWRGSSGHVTSLLRPEIINGGDVDVYLCGPPPMIDAGTAWLKANAVDERRIHVEKFLPS